MFSNFNTQIKLKNLLHSKSNKLFYTSLLFMDSQMEKLSISSKNGESGQEQEEEKCPSEHSEPETELCSCKLSELDLCASVTDSSCIAKVMEKLMDQHKVEKDELKAEKQQLVAKLESEKARADQAEQANAELSKKVAQLEEEEKGKVEERKIKQKTKNSFIFSPNQCYYIQSEYTQFFTRKHRDHLRHLAVSSDNSWEYTGPDPTLSSQFKLQLNFDGTYGIYSSFTGKFLEYGQNGFGLTGNGAANSAKFEFQCVGDEEKEEVDDDPEVKIRSVGGNGYLSLRQMGLHSYDFRVQFSTSKEGTLFTLVPADG